jgi:hypothetical protein
VDVGVLTDAALGNQCPCGCTIINQIDFTYQIVNVFR